MLLTFLAHISIHRERLCKRVSRENVERLAQLFDKLEAEARRLGGANAVENMFDSELAKELTGRSDVRPGVEGLFNTVIRKINYEVARILGLEAEKWERGN
jgi:hypothetical protein